MQQILTTANLTPDVVDHLVGRALDPGSTLPSLPPFVLATLFTTSSLRTRAGFTAATVRLGGHAIHLSELRSSSTMSAPESLRSAVTSLSTMVDAMVIRSGSMDLASDVVGFDGPILNGGDAAGNHPTQALGDLAVLRRHGNVRGLRVGIVGDFSMRAVRSLLELLQREPPALLRCITLPNLETPPWEVGAVEVAHHLDVEGLDLLYVAGLPARCQGYELSAEQRASLAVDDEALRRLGPSSLVYSPGPIIDEVVPSALARLEPELLRSWRLVQAVRTELLAYALR